MQTEDIRWFAVDDAGKVLDILRENGIDPPDISVLPQDRSLQGGTGGWIDEQNYTLTVKGETFPDRRKKHDT